MSEVIDRATRALLAALEGSPNYVSADDACRSVTLDGVFDLQEATRAVVKAMREPSEAMLDGRARTHLLNDRMTGAGHKLPKAQVVCEIYRAMIDAALTRQATSSPASE